MARILLLRGAMGAGKSTVANAMRTLLPEVMCIIEVDDIKSMVHGSAAKCDPKTIFPKAGAMARKELEAGIDVIVIEPLCTREHINFVLDEACVADTSPNFFSVWLHCSLNTALIRKRQKFSDDVIKGQHRRYATRHIIENELLINTDELTPDDVSQQVCKYFRGSPDP